MLEIRGLGHSYDGRKVLKNVSLTVPDGEIAVVMGSSGGGKTTLLKCIAALVSPTEGDILLNGLSVVKDQRSAHERIGMVFQYAALFDYLNVEDNILFGYRRQVGRKQADEKAVLEGLLEAVGLSGTEALMPNELSGGMRKRVGLARALCLEPELLLYDEPTSGLDPVTAYSIDHLIAETRDRTGVTSIVVSHDVTSVLRVADRIIFLHQGEVLYDGNPEGFKTAGSGPIKELVAKSRAENFLKDFGTN